MKYQEAWAFLDNLQFFKIKLGLDSMNMFLNELDSPQRDLKFIHVAGTNGKGSVAATLLTLLARAGYQVGLYTSPHLSSVRERFRINDTFISEEEFARHATSIRDILNGRQITYFEFTTALALLWFQERQVDLVVLEVGLGGRLDATNVVTPLVGIITNVSMDHEAYLGETIAEVASEKAGIIKPQVPLVSGVDFTGAGDEAVVRRVIEETCTRNQAPLFLLGRDFMAESGEDEKWTYWGMKRSGCCQLRGTYAGLVCGLVGDYQPRNAAVALAALELLGEHGFVVAEDDIRQGLLEVKWPGRLETFCVAGDTGKKVDCSESGARRFLLDGAHNPAGVASLRTALESVFTYDRLILVWGAMIDKKNNKTLPQVAHLAEKIVLVRPEGERSADPEELLEFLPSELRDKSICLRSVKQGLAEAIRLTGDNDLICVAGSLYLVGAVRELLLGVIV